jgi:hypothetical protein
MIGFFEVDLDIDTRMSSGAATVAVLARILSPG